LLFEAKFRKVLSFRQVDLRRSRKIATMTIEALVRIIILQGPSEEPESKTPAIPVKRRQSWATTKKAKPAMKMSQKRRPQSEGVRSIWSA
jgi:hypothetical protein